MENKIKELEKNIELLKEELKKKTMLVKIGQNLPDWLEEGVEYYTPRTNFIDCCDGVFSYVHIWDGGFIDKQYLALGLVFPTREEAEHEAKCIYYQHLYRNYVKEHSEQLDWHDSEQFKYYAWWDFDVGGVDVDSYRTNIDACGVYASSSQIIRDAIDFIGEDNFIKYVLEIQDGEK